MIGDWDGLDVDGGTIDFENGSLGYSYAGVSGGNSGSLTLVNDDLTDVLYGVSGSGLVAFTMMNSHISATTDGVGVSATQANVTGNVVSTPTNFCFECGSGIVVFDTTGTVADNSVTTSGLPYEVGSSDLNFPQLASNSMGGSTIPAFEVEGTLAATQTMPDQGYPWIIIRTSGVSLPLDVPSGVTLTIEPGTVIKGSSGSDLIVEGTLNAVGTSTNPIVFTSDNDNSVGGPTGTGSPATGDWNGIAGTTTSSISLENALLEYATTAINVTAGSSSLITVDANSFQSNGTAVSIDASETTNAQIEDNTFLGNNVAINASSNWSTVTADPVSCFYLPTMTATGNTFDGSSDPIVSSTDYALITGGDLASEFGVPTVEDYLSGWTDNIQEGSTDTISVSYEPCIDVTHPLDSYVAIAIPLNLDGSVIVPVGAADRTHQVGPRRSP
jgi:hypothetical protein